MSLAERISQVTAKRSASPRAEENKLDPDWQAGYLYGRFTEAEHFKDIEDEWERRGHPQGNNKSFKSWKAGYWAGIFYQLSLTVK